MGGGSYICGQLWLHQPAIWCKRICMNNLLSHLMCWQKLVVEYRELKWMVHLNILWLLGVVWDFVLEQTSLKSRWPSFFIAWLPSTGKQVMKVYCGRDFLNMHCERVFLHRPERERELTFSSNFQVANNEGRQYCSNPWFTISRWPSHSAQEERCIESGRCIKQN